MHTRVISNLRCVVGVLCAWAVSAPAFAQDNPSAPPKPAPGEGRLIIQQVDNGYAIAPDVRFGRVNGKTATFAGAYGGWVSDDTLLVGGGVYILANGEHDFEMAYGGPLVEWRVRGDQRIGFGMRALVGGGSATLSRPYGELFGTPIGPSPAFEGVREMRGFHGWPDHPHTGLTRDTPVVVSEWFFILEPQANVLWRVTRWMRVNAGVGYRAIAGTEFLGDELRGVSGNLSLEFGK